MVTAYKTIYIRINNHTNKYYPVMPICRPIGPSLQDYWLCINLNTELTRKE